MNQNQRTTNQQSQYRQQGYRTQFSSQYSRSAQLQRERQYALRELARLDAEIDSLHQKEALLNQVKNAHMAAVPFAIGQVTLSLIGVRFLPPVARTWFYKHQELIRAGESLQYQAITLASRRYALCMQIEQIEIDLDALKYQP